jgi:hypothetical protein
MKWKRTEDGYPEKGIECLITNGYSYWLVEYIGEEEWQQTQGDPAIRGRKDDLLSPITEWIELPKLPKD